MSFINQASSQQDASVDWQESVVCYEDSENDLNVISDDEDLETAKFYSQSKSNKYLKCSIIDRVTLQVIREE